MPFLQLRIVKWTISQMFELIVLSMAIMNIDSCKPHSIDKYQDASTRTLLEQKIKTLLPEFLVLDDGYFISSILEEFEERKTNDKPFFAVRDLNKDLQPDAIVFGKEKGKYKILSLISGIKDYQIIELDSFEYYDPKKDFITVPDTKNMSVKKEYGLSKYVNLLTCKDKYSQEERYVVSIGTFMKPSSYYEYSKEDSKFNLIYVGD